MNVLITGGTGSLGKALISLLLQQDEIHNIVVYSRDELKQFELADRLQHDVRVSFMIGDVRDSLRLSTAMLTADTVIHAAALKQVPVCEMHPSEAVQTNIMGTLNVCAAAIKHHVSTVIFVSTDKAVNPVNMYGATKLCAEKIMVQANHKSGTNFSVCRYGNVFMSRGSVVPFFAEQAARGLPIPITHPDMTRFWITLPQAAQFVWDSVKRSRGGEIFVPKLPSVQIINLAKAVCGECVTEVVGIRPGEKIHELLITADETRNTTEFPDYYQILPDPTIKRVGPKGKELPSTFTYTSGTNDTWLTVEDLQRVLKEELRGAH